MVGEKKKVLEWTSAVKKKKTLLGAGGFPYNSDNLLGKLTNGRSMLSYFE